MLKFPTSSGLSLPLSWVLCLGWEGALLVFSNLYIRNIYLRNFSLAVFASFWLLASAPLLAQSHLYRIAADVTVKEELPNGQQRLSIGKVYFDKNSGQVIWKMSFPEKEVYVYTNDMAYVFKSDSLVEKKMNPIPIEQSVFSLILSSKLENFGLSDSPYKLTTVEKDGSSTISTWIPPETYNKQMGEILLSSTTGRLNGLVVLDPEGNVLFKQFFKDYQTISTLDVPGKIIQESSSNGQTLHKVTELKNVRINEKNNQPYSHPLGN